MIRSHGGPLLKLKFHEMAAMSAVASKAGDR